MIKRTLKKWRYKLLFIYKMERLFSVLIRVKDKLTGRKIALDASSICQLKCPACSTANKQMGIVGWGFLTFSNFRNVVDENPDIRQIELSNWGELFLNPEIADIMKYAHDNNIRLTAENGVNLNHVKEKALDAAVKYQFRLLSVSIDGASAETYEQYRRKGNFDKVIENIKKINELKEKYNSIYPVMQWQFIIFGHNEHELPKAKLMAKDLNLVFKPKLNHTPEFSSVKDPDFVKKETGIDVNARQESKDKKKERYIMPCFQLWEKPQINWDGKVLGCCVNKSGSFGNAFEEPLKNILKNEKYRYAKRMIIGKEKPDPEIPCTACPIYIELSKGSPGSGTVLEDVV